MSAKWIRFPGCLVQGHQVASRPSRDYPYSSLEKQKPFFKKLGLDLYQYFNGTLNISISPWTFEMSAPEFTFPLVEWTDLHPPETFSFSRCRVRFEGEKYEGWVYYPHPETFSFSQCRVMFEGKEYEGWVYYPHPETKRTHFQNPSLVEVITCQIPQIQYDDRVEIELNPSEIQIRKP